MRLTKRQLGIKWGFAARANAVDDYVYLRVFFRYENSMIWNFASVLELTYDAWKALEARFPDRVDWLNNGTGDAEKIVQGNENGI